MKTDEHRIRRDAEEMKVSPRKLTCQGRPTAVANQPSPLRLPPCTTPTAARYGKPNLLRHREYSAIYLEWRIPLNLCTRLAHRPQDDNTGALVSPKERAGMIWAPIKCLSALCKRWQEFIEPRSRMVCRRASPKFDTC